MPHTSVSEHTSTSRQAKMKGLLDLPEEILCDILALLVVHDGIKAVVQARPTCKAFDSLILSTTWITRALEADNRPSNVGDEFVTKCLFARTCADWLCHRYTLTKIIAEMVEFLRQMHSPQPDSGCDFVLEACRSVVWANSRCLDCSDKVMMPQVLMRDVTVRDTVQENTLAFAAHLGLISVVRRLIEDGTRSRHTHFGHPLTCAARTKDSSLTQMYLDATLRLAQRPAIGFPDRRFKRRRTLSYGRRDLTSRNYEEAMANAMSFGCFETLQILMTAASDDNAWPSHTSAGSWTAVIRKHEWSPTTHHYSAVLWYAADRDLPALAEFALSQGADAEGLSRGREDMWITTLERAALSGSLKIFNLLLDHGADIHHGGAELLCGAVGGGSLEIVKACLGADIKVTDSDDYLNPLVRAVRYKRPDILQLLLQHGVELPEADTYLEDELDDAARAASHSEIDAILETARRKLQTE